MENNYQVFEKYIVKSPLLSIDVFYELTSQSIVSKKYLKEKYNDPLIKSAIICFSYELYSELEIWFSNDTKLDDDIIKYKFISLLCQLATNVNNLGFFTTSSINHIEKKNNSSLSDSLHVRLNMEVLIYIKNLALKIPDVKNNLIYELNSSLHTFENDIKYINTQIKEFKRDHNLESIEKNEDIEQILAFIKEKKKPAQIVKYITSFNYSEENALEFVDNLIDSQIIVSEIEVYAVGENYFNFLIDKLSSLNIKNQFITLLNEIHNDINSINKSSLKIEFNYFERVISKLNLFLPLHLKRSQLTVNITREKKSLEIQQEVLTDVKEGMEFLNLLTTYEHDILLKEYKNQFKEKYKNKKIPLTQALDPDLGINYINHSISKDYYQNLDGVSIPIRRSSIAKKINLFKIDILLIKKITESNTQCIKISKDELLNTSLKMWDNLDSDSVQHPDTISMRAKVIYEHNIRKIILSGNIGSSAINSLIPLQYGNTDIYNYVKEIASFEKNNNKGITAEISHLPKNCVQYIFNRPLLFDYEIPYLSNSNSEKTIDINTLYIYMEGNNMILKSKNMEEEIIPRISALQSFVYGSLPIYHFLCSLQTQGKKLGLHFKPNEILFNELTFTPRIEFNNIIISKARWNINTEEIISFLTIEDNSVLTKKIHEFINKYSLPKYVSFIYYNDILPIDLENITFVKMLAYFLSKAKLPKVILTEHLFNNDSSKNTKPHEELLILNYFKSKHIKQ